MYIVRWDYSLSVCLSCLLGCVRLPRIKPLKTTTVLCAHELWGRNSDRAERGHLGPVLGSPECWGAGWGGSAGSICPGSGFSLRPGSAPWFFSTRLSVWTEIWVQRGLIPFVSIWRECSLDGQRRHYITASFSTHKLARGLLERPTCFTLTIHVFHMRERRTWYGIHPWGFVGSPFSHSSGMLLRRESVRGQWIGATWRMFSSSSSQTPRVIPQRGRELHSPLPFLMKRS